jgi:multiple sugar transport system substrate-binding protein
MRNMARPSWIPVPTLIAVLALVAAACGPAASPGASPGGGSPGAGSPGAGSPAAGSPGAGGDVVMISSQLVPVAESEKMQTVILADFDQSVQFIGAESGPFNDQIRAQEQAGAGDISLIGGLHGEFSTFAAEDLLMDLSDVVGEIGDVNAEYLELGKLGTDQQLYIPWMQNTYIMAARQEAMDYLPEGADINALTWEQVSEWGAAIATETGDKKLGFPAGTDGLWHRFFQGYAYPAFTGGVNTTFASEDAATMWSWLADTWSASVNPQSTTYTHMQQPLQSGDVWIAWDHAARLIDALRDEAAGVVAFPAPAGPEGRAFMPVVAGLAIPKSAPNADGAKELIKYLLTPETQATTLREVAFFPVITADLPGELEPGTQAEQEAVATMTSADDALPSLLPIGLGDQGTAYNKVFRDAFQQIVLDGGDPATVLEARKVELQATLDTSGAACWPPDEPSTGACQVE